MLVAVLLLPGKDLEGEGQGENFVPWAQNVQGIVEKKRKRVSSRDAEDAKLDEAARKLEAALDKLERDNKQLMSCFVTLGEQMKTMMNENKQLKSVLACYNDGMNGRQNAPSKSCHHKAENISPTVQLLAQVALLSGSLAK